VTWLVHFVWWNLCICVTWLIRDVMVTSRPYSWGTTHFNTLQHTSIHCNTLQRVGSKTEVQHTASRCNTLQHTATHCNKQAVKLRYNTSSEQPIIDINSGPWILQVCPFWCSHFVPCLQLQHTATFITATYCNRSAIWHVLVWFVQCHTMKRAATHCNNSNTLQHTPTHSNTL